MDPTTPAGPNDYKTSESGYKLFMLKKRKKVRHLSLFQGANSHMTCPSDADQSDAAGERGRSFHRGGGPVTPLGDGKSPKTREHTNTRWLHAAAVCGE